MRRGASRCGPGSVGGRPKHNRERRTVINDQMPGGTSGGPTINHTDPTSPTSPASSAGCLGLARGDQPAVAQCDSPARCCSALQESERDNDPRTLIWLPPSASLLGVAAAARYQVVWSRLAVSFPPPRSMRGLRSVRWPSPTGFFVAGEGRGRWATLGMRETESRSIQADGHDWRGEHSFNRGMTPAICPDRGGGPSVPTSPSQPLGSVLHPHRAATLPGFSSGWVSTVWCHRPLAEAPFGSCGGALFFFRSMDGDS